MDTALDMLDDIAWNGFMTCDKKSQILKKKTSY